MICPYGPARMVLPDRAVPSGQLPERPGETPLGEQRLIVPPGMGLEVVVEAVPVPDLREVPHRARGNISLVRCVPVAPLLDVVPGAEQADHRARARDVLPPLVGGPQEGRHRPGRERPSCPWALCLR